jgi:hypothetical protein
MIAGGIRMRGEGERGQSLVELATGMMFLLILLAGIVDAGRALFTKAALLDAAEEGALYGSYRPTDVGGIESRMRDNADGLVDLSDLDGIEISVDYLGSKCAGNLLVVSISYDFLISTPFIGTILGNQTFPISATSESLILSPVCE